jgi:hypothetical protein
MNKINKKQLQAVESIFANFFIFNSEVGVYTSNISNVKIYFKENDENLYITYLNRYIQIEGPTNEIYYLKIDIDGNCETLFPLNNSDEPMRLLQLKIEHMFSELTIANFNITLADWYRMMKQDNNIK